MKRAEALCKRKKNTTYDWSPVLARMGGRVCYWKQRRQCAKDNTNIMVAMSRQKTLGIQDSGDEGLVYINCRLRAAWKELHEAQKSAGILRLTHLEELAAHRGESEGASAVTELKKLIHVEKVRNTAKNTGGT